MEEGQKDEKHLWEFDHPYYCNEGNYYKIGHHESFESWADFVENGDLLYDGDLDLNLLFRWDWHAWHLEYPEDHPDGDERHALSLFFMIQRKGFNLSREIAVTAEDEPAVRSWLWNRAERMRLIWDPLLANPTHPDA